MRNPDDAPSVVPSLDRTVYLVLDDFGKLGRAYREADERFTDEGSVIQGLLSGEFEDPVRIVAFNLDQGWCADVSEEVAHQVLDRARERGFLPESTRRFLERTLDVAIPDL